MRSPTRSHPAPRFCSYSSGVLRLASPPFEPPVPSRPSINTKTITTIETILSETLTDTLVAWKRDPQGVCMFVLSTRNTREGRKSQVAYKTCHKPLNAPHRSTQISWGKLHKYCCYTHDSLHQVREHSEHTPLGTEDRLCINVQS